MNWGIIELVIEICSAIVFDGVLDGRYKENKNKGYTTDFGIRGSKNWENLNLHQPEHGIMANTNLQQG